MPLPLHEVDALYRKDLREFTSARNALAATLKQNGQAAGASAVRALRKPGLAAWTVNQLWWRRRELFENLLEAAARCGAAQRDGAGPIEQRKLDELRRNTLNSLLTEAQVILRDAGHASAVATVRRITTTLEAAAAQPADLDPPLGRLVEPLEPLGFALAFTGSASYREQALETALAANPTQQEPDDERTDIKEARLQILVAQQAYDQATDRLARANRALDRAAVDADTAATAAAQHQATAEAAAVRANKAIKAASDAKDAALLADRAARQAQTQLQQREQEVAAAEEASSTARRSLRAARDRLNSDEA